MATADEYAAWIVRNKDKQGTPEFEIVAQAYQQAKTEAPTPTPQNDPTAADDESFGSAAVIGAGRTLDRLYKGGKDLALSVPAAFGHEGANKERARMAEVEAENTRFYKQLQDKRPGATFLGEVAPLVAGLPAMGTVGGAAAMGALPGLIEYGTAGERMERGAYGALGGAAGAGLGKVISTAIQPNKVAPTAAQSAAQAAAGRIGVKLRPDEITQSRPLKWMNAALDDLPFSAGMAQRADLTRKSQINSAGARSIGQNATEIGEDTLANARTAISGTFNQILSPLQITLDKSFQNDVRAITGSKVLRGLRDDSVDALIEPFKNLPGTNVRISGDWFQQNKTALNDAIRSAYTSGAVGKAKALEQFEAALDRAATRAMPATERKAYDAARKQWANLRILETGQVVEAGNIVPSRVDAALRSRYKQAYKEGKINGELPDIGRMAQAYKSMPQSGTAPRQLYSAAAGGAFFAHPAITAAMLSGPPLAQKFLQSDAGRKYLTKGMAEVTPEMEKWLMLGGSGLLGLPAIGAAGQ